MAQFRKGVDAFEASQRRSTTDFTPRLKWKAGETKHIQFLTPAEEIPTVELYDFMIVGHNDNTNKPIYRSFISPRDPALLEDNPDARDYFQERIKEGKKSALPKKRQVAVVAVIEPEYGTAENSRRKEYKQGKLATRTYVNREGVEIEVPDIGLVIGSSVFFGYFFTFSQRKNLEDYVFAVERRGGDQNTQYHPFDVGPALDLNIPDEAYIDLDAYLSELADEERMREYVADKPADWVFDSNAEKAAGRNTRTRTAVADEPENESLDPKSKFQGLRSRTKAATAD